MNWDIPGIGEVRLRGFVNSVNDVQCLDIDDWIPVDPESFSRLNRLLA